MQQFVLKCMNIRWSLRALFLIVTLFSAVCCFVNVAVMPYYRNAQLVSHWREAGAILIVDDETNDITLLADMGPGRFKTTSLQNISSVPQLKHLVLSETSINDKNLIWLKSLDSLESLALNDTSISGEGIAHLKKLVSLRHLHLSNTKITDQSIEVLGGLRNLESLAISGTQITSQGRQRIYKLLPQTKVYAASGQEGGRKNRH